MENSGNFGGLLSRMTTSRSDSGYGSGRSSTLFTTEKIAVQAPMPMASVRRAMAVTEGALDSWRSAWRRLRIAQFYTGQNEEGLTISLDELAREGARRCSRGKGWTDFE